MVTPASPPSGPLPDDEVEMDTYSQDCGGGQVDNGAEWSVSVTVDDCNDDTCHRCYKPLDVEITLVDAHGHAGLRFDVADGWDQFDRFVRALTEARHTTAS